MISKSNGWYDFSKVENYYVAYGPDENKLLKEIEEFVKEHATESNAIYLTVRPEIKPSKVNLRPEYMYEIHILDRERAKDIAFIGFVQLHPDRWLERIGFSYF